MFVALHPFVRKACEDAYNYISSAYAPDFHVTAPDHVCMEVGHRLEYEYAGSRVDYSKYRSKFKSNDLYYFLFYSVVYS